MPPSLKGALVREVARRGGNLNDVATGILAERFGVAYRPTGRRSPLAGSSNVTLLRMPAELKQQIQSEAFRSGSNTNDVILLALADSLGIPFESNRSRSVPFGGGRRKETPVATTNGSANGTRPLQGQGARRDHRRRQLRQLAPPGRRVLQGRRPGRSSSPASCTSTSAATTSATSSSRPRSTSTTDKVGKDLADAIWAHPNDTIKFAEVPKTGDHGLARHDARRHRQVPLRDRHEGAGRDRRRRRASSRRRGTDVVVNYLPVGSEEATKWYAEQILEAGCAMVNCMPVFIAREAYWQTPLRGGGPADHRRRHQVAGRRDDRPPRADAPLPRARRPPRPDDAAQRRRQHGLPEHARARAPRVEEDLEDERGHVDARLRHGREERPRRPVGLRAVADRPQVGLHPHGGLRLRRRAAQRRAEARGLGLAELGRHRHRRRAPREAGAEQRRRRRARGAVERT